MESLGFSGLVTLALVSIWRGWWMPASTVKALCDSRDERIKELAATNADLLATVRLKDETMHEQGSQVDELLELARTGNALMRALATAAGKDPA